jgi:uncharacterized membrane protein
MMGYGNYGFGGNSFMGGWTALVMLFFGALVVAGVVVLIIWAVRSNSGHGHVPGTAAGSTGATGTVGHDEAVAIAKRRLASGEIDKDHYDEIMRSLSS